MVSTADRDAAISTHACGGRTIVRLCGALDIEGTPALRERLIDMLHRGPGLLVLDLSQVLSCDASGLAALIGTQRRARLLGIMMRLVAPSPPAADGQRSSAVPALAFA